MRCSRPHPFLLHTLSAVTAPHKCSRTQDLRVGKGTFTLKRICVDLQLHSLLLPSSRAAAPSCHHSMVIHRRGCTTLHATGSCMQTAAGDLDRPVPSLQVQLRFPPLCILSSA